MSNDKITVAVGMSGGVDSSLTAALLLEQGYRVIGISMEIYSGESTEIPLSGHACYGPGEMEDMRLAAQVADFLNIPHHALDLRTEYKETVLDYFTSEYLAGKTPNPCTRCNPMMKFGFLVDRARKAGIQFDKFATGHYARVVKDSKQGHQLHQGLDLKKDQSYFLYALPRTILADVLFPLGEMTKEQVRIKAAALNIPVHDRPESQDFLEGDGYASLFQLEKITPGPILDRAGKKLGEHRGIIHYTIGQRRGLAIPHSEPLYVIDIDAANNIVRVGPKEALLSSGLIATDLNYLANLSDQDPIKISAKIRHNHPAASADLYREAAGQARLIFQKPQRSITPGQSVVFYDNDRVLGGGIISHLTAGEYTTP